MEKRIILTMTIDLDDDGRVTPAAIEAAAVEAAINLPGVLSVEHDLVVVDTEDA